MTRIRVKLKCVRHDLSMSLPYSFLPSWTELLQKTHSRNYPHSIIDLNGICFQHDMDQSKLFLRKFKNKEWSGLQFVKTNLTNIALNQVWPNDEDNKVNLQRL